MDRDYWIDIVGRLKDPVEAGAAAHIIATGLGYGMDLEDTNLGEALNHVRHEEMIMSVIQAYQNTQAQTYCDQVLWYFEPEEIVSIYKQIENPGQNIQKGVKRFLKEVESPLVNQI
jgi:hypothetical protein